MDSDGNGNDGGAVPCGKLEGYATWVGLSVVSAFFASMERFYCIHLHTMDDGDEDDDDLEDALPDHCYDRSASNASFVKM